MAGEPAASGTPAEPASQPQAGTTQPTPPASAAPAASAEPQAGDAESISLEKAREMRQEMAALRKRNKEFEDAKRAADEANLSEVERLSKRVKELEESAQASQAEARTLRLRSAVEREAYKRQFADAADAYRLIDHDAIKLNDDGEPTNVGTILDNLAKSKPYLLVTQPTANGTPPYPVSPTPRPTNGSTVLDAERERLRRETERRARLGH